MIPYKHKPQLDKYVVQMPNHWAAEFPVGDPFGGPAYGEKEFKKLFKAALAVAAVVATGGAALAAGTFAGALTASSVFAGVAFAGSALSLVGTVTGNQKLVKIGGIASLAGGVGMLGTNIVNSGAATFGEKFTEGWAQTVKDLSDGAKTGWDKLTNSLGMTPTADTSAFSSSIKPGATEGLSSAGGADMLGTAGPSIEGSLYGGPADPRISLGSGVSSTGIGPGSQVLASPTAFAGAQPSGGGLVSSAMGFAKNNPTALLIGGQALAGAAEARQADKSMQRQLQAQQSVIDGQIQRANSIGYTFPGSPQNVDGVDLYQNRKPTMPLYSVDPTTGMIRRNMPA